MRIANLAGRLVIVGANKALDVEQASAGRFSSDPQAVYAHWHEFILWASTQDAEFAVPFSESDLGPVVPRPPQVFAIGLNYASHADESGFDAPADPVVFTKFVSSLCGPDEEVELHGDAIDWEAELVVVIGGGGRDITEQDAWEHVAGLTVGQDLSDRTVQFWGHPPQFSLGKSRAGFTPIGPEVVTIDEVDRLGNRDDLAITCSVTHADGSSALLQDGRTSSLIFTIPTLIARLSSVVELLPGDLIFTGTPAGVGFGRDPQVYLKDGDTLTTRIETLGTIVQRFAAQG